MATALERFYASDGPDRPIATIEITRASRPDPILICQGFNDLTCMTEDARLLTFVAGAIDVSIPKRDNSGNQNVGFAIDNVTGFAQQYIAEAIDAGEPVTLVLRIYLESDLTAPAERPYRMRVKGADFESLTVQVEAGYYDLINTAALRHIYNVSEFPGLKYWP
ncbi:DUF1833 family protein [Pseudomonas aeruginosa]|uniref:DUF1833 family protein n=1 Tax=Pseudomonas aeruginosa TaxID=287 RepID=UPI003EE28AA9|nr:DUF1833 domain-containing protein [Pseudomonas aeruginosa]